jgi:5-hydroxyisourate hydrolase
MAKLSTHVLDTSRGVPAARVTVDLHAIDRGDRRHVQTVDTNQDGRTDQPLLAGDRIAAGTYELTFHAGDYFRRAGVVQDRPAFLELVVIRFEITDVTGNYHVPLLLSPFAYTTYRGS